MNKTLSCNSNKNNYMPHTVPACMDVKYYNTKQNICLSYMWLGGRVFRLPSHTHNYIVSNLGGCIIERLDRRLTKCIYNILHGDNNVIKTIVQSKLYMSPKSIIAENYKYISYKYKLTLTGQRVSIMSLIRENSFPKRIFSH